MKVNLINVFAILIASLLLSSCVNRLNRDQSVNFDLEGFFDIKVTNERSGYKADKGGVMNVIANDLLWVEVSPLRDLDIQEYASVNILYFDEDFSHNLGANELPFSFGIKVPELPVGKYPISITCTLQSENIDIVYVGVSTFDMFVQVK